jgi:fructose-1,6-bisphosphatase/sedoheptulose 1,7-bisphosphatase-like protein
MHTAIIITFGLVLLALMLYIGEKIGFSRQPWPTASPRCGWR